MKERTEVADLNESLPKEKSTEINLNTEKVQKNAYFNLTVHNMHRFQRKDFSQAADVQTGQ